MYSSIPLILFANLCMVNKKNMQIWYNKLCNGACRIVLSKTLSSSEVAVDFSGSRQNKETCKEKQVLL